MAGDHGPLIVDPALAKYNQMVTDRYKFFRWTPRSVWLNVTYVLVIPALVGYVAYSTDGKYYMRGKKRGDVIKEF